jgi:acetyl/propionyl-CoA carboxylase alpha subunit
MEMRDYICKLELADVSEGHGFYATISRAKEKDQIFTSRPVIIRANIERLDGDKIKIQWGQQTDTGGLKLVSFIIVPRSDLGHREGKMSLTSIGEQNSVIHGILWKDPTVHVAPGESADGSTSDIASIKAPMPCKVASVSAGTKHGQAVKKGAALLVLEAMKMEHVLRAPWDGVIEKVSPMLVQGTLVPEGHVLVTVAKK